MDLDEARRFLASNHRAVLAARRRDGSPQLSPVLVGLDREGRATVSTRETAMKTLNVRRDPHVWLCVLNDRFYGNWIQLTGTAQVLSLPEAMEPLVEYYRGISGEHPDWDDYRPAVGRPTWAGAGPRVAPGPPYEPVVGFSRALRVGERVLVAGTAPIWPDGSCDPDPQAQAARCLEIILAALAEGGDGPEHVVS